jgi:hypothetical protein
MNGRESERERQNAMDAIRPANPLAHECPSTSRSERLARQGERGGDGHSRKPMGIDMEPVECASYGRCTEPSPPGTPYADVPYGVSIMQTAAAGRCKWCVWLKAYDTPMFYSFYVNRILRTARVEPRKPYCWCTSETFKCGEQVPWRSGSNSGTSPATGDCPPP